MIIKTKTKRQPSVCFHCGREFETRTYFVINACETPEIALELIEERHFTNACPHCGKTVISFADPMYYFDVERNIALVYSQYWQQVKIKHYWRYMDDFYLIHNDKEYLKKCYKAIVKHLKAKGLELNEKKSKLQKISQPIHFLGFSFKLKPNGKIAMRVLSDNISKNRKKLKKLVIIKGVNKSECDKVLQAILAHMKKSNNRSQVNKMIKYYKDLWKEKNNVTR